MPDPNGSLGPQPVVLIGSALARQRPVTRFGFDRHVESRAEPLRQGREPRALGRRGLVLAAVGGPFALCPKPILGRLPRPEPRELLDRDPRSRFRRFRALIAGRRGLPLP